jgi:hypothetical protein
MAFDENNENPFFDDGDTDIHKPRQAIEASDFRAVRSGTLQGFCCLHTPSGWNFRDVAYHIKNGSRWIQLPAKPQLDPEGRQRVDPVSGKKLYSPVVELDRDKRDKFQEQALAALDRLLAGSSK